ncbi:hypothetical protein OGZ37_10960 [Lactococcus lactis]|nr:hypothetical protein [Lactococcus lactis]
MDLVQYRAQYIRGYLPRLVERLDFKSPRMNDDGLINALRLISVLKKENKRKIPADIELNFVKKPWQSLVKNKNDQLIVLILY